MSKLSIFVDESGDFGPYEKHAPYYIIAMVFHDQSDDLTSDMKKLDRELQYMGYYHHVVHTEPLIRREEDYKNLSPNERRSIFTKLFYFFKRCMIKYKTFIFIKRDYEDTEMMEAKMVREMARFLKEHLTYFQAFEEIVLYYDNGQNELSKILHAVFTKELPKCKVRKVLSCNYKLFQVADLVCTLELLKVKMETKELSRSEQLIFHNKKALKKDFLKGLKEKEF